MNDLRSDAGSLVRAAREETGLTAEERARMRAKIMTAARAGAFAAVGTAGFAAAAKTFVSSTVVWVVAGSLAVTGAGVYYARSNANAPHVQQTQAMLPPNDVRAELPAVGENATKAPAIEEGTPAVSAQDDAPRSIARLRAPEAKSRAAPAPGADTTFAEDARLLRDVRTALSAGQNERALALLDSRKAGLPAGALAEEREAARIVTLCKLGRGAEARARATRFLAAHGSSPLAERVRRACAAER
jgi:hypothetical protein